MTTRQQDILADASLHVVTARRLLIDNLDPPRSDQCEQAINLLEQAGHIVSEMFAAGSGKEG